MKHILIFIIIILVMSSCEQRKSYTLHQQDEWEFDITKTRDSIFVKNTTYKTCYVDTFYKEKSGFYATWNKKILFATVDTDVYDTNSVLLRPINPIYRIRKVTDSLKDPILNQYSGCLYKTEIVSYKNIPDFGPKLLITYYYDRNYNIVGIIVPYSIVFVKGK